MINLYKNHRGHFNRCKYFVRDENDRVGDLSQYIYKKNPNGFFMAKEITANSNEKAQTNNVFLYDKNNITISTNDIVKDLVAGCIVIYKNEPWIVVSVQTQIAIKNTEYMSIDKASTTIINMRK